MSIARAENLLGFSKQREVQILRESKVRDGWMLLDAKRWSVERFIDNTRRYVDDTLYEEMELGKCKLQIHCS